MEVVEIKTKRYPLVILSKHLMKAHKRIAIFNQSTKRIYVSDGRPTKVTGLIIEPGGSLWFGTDYKDWPSFKVVGESEGQSVKGISQDENKTE